MSESDELNDPLLDNSDSEEELIELFDELLEENYEPEGEGNSFDFLIDYMLDLFDFELEMEGFWPIFLFCSLIILFLVTLITAVCFFIKYKKSLKKKKKNRQSQAVSMKVQCNMNSGMVSGVPMLQPPAAVYPTYASVLPQANPAAVMPFGYQTAPALGHPVMANQIVHQPQLPLVNHNMQQQNMQQQMQHIPQMQRQQVGSQQYGQPPPYPGNSGVPQSQFGVKSTVSHIPVSNTTPPQQTYSNMSTAPI